MPMPVTAAMREATAGSLWSALKSDPSSYLEKDFAALLETVALGNRVKLESENSPYPTGLEVQQ